MSKEITCPNCGRSFEIDEASYYRIARQVRDTEFSAELEKICRKYEDEKKQAVEIAVLQAGLKAEKIAGEKRLAEEQARSRELALREEYEGRLRAKEAEAEYYRDLKARMSTKMVGETLERHCENEFNRIRMAAFPDAYFEKDNAVSRTGSKGDYIFRESRDGTEIISIMFEMKNEMEATEKKHKNEDFFKELDKDRNEKGCEYAVLVSMLEADSEYYNQGIVDVSYRYPKMYVIRPQFFIPMITILRNAAQASAGYKKLLEEERNKSLDVERFEANMEEFKKGFGKNYELASRKFSKAVEEIDKTIEMLQKTRDDLVSSDRNLRLANDKAQGLTIRKLVRGAPSIAERFGAMAGGKAENADND